LGVRLFFWATLSAFRSRFRRGGELHSSRVAGKVFLENLFWISRTAYIWELWDILRKDDELERIY